MSFEVKRLDGTGAVARAAALRAAAVPGHAGSARHEANDRASPVRAADDVTLVPFAVVQEVAACARATPALLDDLEGLDLAEIAWPRTRAFARRLGERLWRSTGHRRLVLPVDHGLDPASRRLLFLALAAALGRLLTQYGRLYAVKDRGADYRTSALPVSMTRDRTGFHTDSSARGVLPDFVGLLCERPAAQGGDSLVSDALRVRQALARRSPRAWALLQRPYVRDLVTPGVEFGPEALAQNHFPVFARDGAPAGWTLRYMRYWLERGQERAGEPVPADVAAALDLLDELLAAPEHVARFRLDAGDMLWINNRTTAHDRDAFVDDPAAPRLLWRAWVQRDA